VSLFWGRQHGGHQARLLDAPPLRLAWMRFLLGGLVIALWGRLTGRATLFTIRRAERVRILVAGLCFVNLWLLGRDRPSALAALFLTQPIFGVLLAALVAGDPLSLQPLIACLAVALGIAPSREGGGGRVAGVSPGRASRPAGPTSGAGPAKTPGPLRAGDSV
jgi:drug/metabolite transporter (DMT)-like permease